MLERKITNLRDLQASPITQRGMSINEIRNQLNECLERQEEISLQRNTTNDETLSMTKTTTP